MRKNLSFRKWEKTPKDQCSTSLIMKEMQIKTTVKYHLIPVRMTIIKKTTNNKSW